MNQGPLERASFSTLVIYSLPAAAAEISLDHQGRGGASLMKSFRDVSALLFIPLWICLSRVIGKKKLWLFSMATMAVGYFGLFIVQESNRG